MSDVINVVKIDNVNNQKPNNSVSSSSNTAASNQATPQGNSTESDKIQTGNPTQTENKQVQYLKD